MSLIIPLILLLAFGIGLYKIFEKAGVAGWKAMVPGLNIYEWLNITGRPVWWLILILIPLVNIFVVVYMLIDLAKCFGKYGFHEHALAFLFPFVYMPFLGFSAGEKYIGKSVLLDKENPRNKSAIREWSEAIIFAVFAATFIRMFLIEAYTIPTPSMENSLMVGDFLFVSKVNYGSRMPMTPLSFPLVHNKIPFTGSESYTKAVQWKYKRLSGFQQIESLDPVVFNFPEGDTVAIATPQFLARFPQYYNRTHYYGHLRDMGRDQVYRNFKIITRPVDKKDNYIKRCVGLPGNTIEIKDRQLFIDGNRANNPSGMQYLYRVFTNGVVLNTRKLDEWNIKLEEGNQFAFMDSLQAEKILTLGENISIEPVIEAKPDRNIFPHDLNNYAWNRDNFGPLTIPKAGETVTLGPNNISIYKKIIKDYEGNDLKIESGRILINGEEARSYTFKMNYYWMMGDNRHNSEDSRVWGFVPEDHIVGKPLFIWLSLKNSKLFGKDGGIRFNRMFTTANKK